ncbi:MAG TPA: DUF4147 domain-containing protein [Anaerolineales bacterium]|nr:DUF4147 domain-containing protein [Anaerolineales bacterium]
MRRATPAFSDHLEHFQRLRAAALAAVDPAASVRRRLRRRRGALFVDRTKLVGDQGRVFLIAMGKAAVPMFRAAAEIVGDSLAGGVVSGPGTAVTKFPGGVHAFDGGHPLPNDASLAAGTETAALLSSAGPDDLVVALISGGGSAMLEYPVDGVSLEDLRSLTETLLLSGLPIQAINTIRCALSQVKAGGLVRMAAPARVLGIVLSDVPGDSLKAVASGPTVAQPDRRKLATEILRRAGLWERLPESVARALLKAVSPTRPRVDALNTLAGSNRNAVEAVAREARSLGFDVVRVARPLYGEAAVIGGRFARRLMREKPRTCLVAGGETTVRIENGGKGGRNQELALRAALVLDGRPGLAVMAFATDGVDGPTDAAGAIVSHATAADLRDRNVDAQNALRRHDSFHALEAAGALIRTGATGTNVADVVVGLKYAG